MKEMIPLSLRQRKAFVWWARREYEDYAAIICDGAIRSGKTLAMGMGFFFWAMACFSDRQFALCGRSVGALRRNLLETVLPQLRRLGFACEEKRSEKLLIVRRRGRENRFYLFGGANEASAALIQGMTLAGVLFDEAALMPRSFVEQASARCSVEGSRLWFSCNPEGPNHWFYREWVCRAEEKRALYVAGSLDAAREQDDLDDGEVRIYAEDDGASITLRRNGHVEIEGDLFINGAMYVPPVS